LIIYEGGGAPCRLVRWRTRIDFVRGCHDGGKSGEATRGLSSYIRKTNTATLYSTLFFFVRKINFFRNTYRHRVLVRFLPFDRRGFLHFRLSARATITTIQLLPLNMGGEKYNPVAGNS